ncbi:MAG TPA: tetratricopeptide repeat protein, partial [Blastocatellia bacterium]|nr:tetratricopeptide repeat protein [Blastocatellia bacterium]
MIQESDEKIIRNHLLGNLTEEELSRAEQRLLADDDYFEMLTVIEEELIDDYVSGDLTGEDRKQFEAYFLSTPARREKLRFAQTLNEYASRTDPPVPIPTPIPRPVWWKQMFSSPYFGLAAAAAAVILIGVGFATWPWFSPGPEASRGMAALKEAYRDQRPVESRITGFDHAPPPLVTRGAEQEKFDYVARDSAERIIFDAVREHPNAKSYHDLGRLYLAKHDFDKAIEQFDKALTSDDKNAQLHNDYAVALIEKGKAVHSKDDGDNSLEYFARALEHLK